jgi:hypothetical protein
MARCGSCPLTAGYLGFDNPRKRLWMFLLPILRALALLGLTLPLVSYGQLNMTAGVTSIEDPILLGDGRFEDYKTGIAATPRLLQTRAPMSDELKLNDIGYVGRQSGLYDFRCSAAATTCLWQPRAERYLALGTGKQRSP